MKGLFEYAAALADWDTDGRVRAVYAANIEALRVLLPDTAAMEREVMAARAAALSDGMPRPDMSDYRCLLQCNWQVILFLRRCGLTFDTQAREREALFSRVACCMLIAGYTDSIREGETDREDKAAYAALAADMAYLMADCAFWGSSVLSNRQYKQSKQAAAARAAGVAKSFKTDFKNRVAYPRWKACADKGFERGGKAELIRQLLKSYENAVIAAMRQRTVLHESEQLLSEKTVREWIKEFEIKGKK